MTFISFFMINMASKCIPIVVAVFVLLSCCSVEGGPFSDAGSQAANNPAASMIMNMMPPECKKEVNIVVKKADDTYNNLKNKKCAECPDGVKASSTMLLKTITLKAVNSYLDWLAKEDMDVDKICSEKVRRAELMPAIDYYEKKCVTPYEFPGHQDLCKARKEDFPKTGDCFSEEGTKIMNERGSPPPMRCVNRALKKCNTKDMGKWDKHFMDDMKKNPNVHKGKNAWTIENSFFKKGCTGEYQA